jgi:hypothetical protein
VRFDPPAIAAPPGLAWALIRAFGPRDAPCPTPPTGPEALETARLFDLAPRIGGRWPLELLAAEIGARSAAAFAVEHGMARRAAVGFGQLTATVATAASSIGVPLVLLKFAALRATGRMEDGLRVAGDIDVLVSAERAWDLASALARVGFRPAGFPASRHHLPQLRDAKGGSVEVHPHLAGVRLPGTTGDASVDRLREAGLVERVDLDGECLVPTGDVLAAHAIVHAVAQHGFGPRGYPMLRMVADLIALGAHADDGRLGRAAAPLVSPELEPEEAEAALALSTRLARGDVSLLDEASPEGVLLRHIVAAWVDEDYAGSLYGRRLARKVHGPVGLAVQAVRALWLTDAQIDVIYGRPRTRLGYLGRRLARPFDLVRRLVVYTAADRRLRARRARPPSRD